MGTVTTLLLLMAATGSVMGSVGSDSRPVSGTLDGASLSLEVGGVHCDGHLDWMTKDGGLGSVHCPGGKLGSVEWSIVGPGRIRAVGYLEGYGDLSLSITQD